MTASGKHGRGGPVPDPNALRRDRPSDQAGWVHLPAAGRTGESPAWPLSRSSPRERVLWDRQWQRPQAVVWEANGQAEEVAIYVRALAVAERPRAPVAARTLVRQLMDSLGLSVPGLRSNRWIISSAEAAPVERATAGPGSARERLKLVVGG